MNIRSFFGTLPTRLPYSDSNSPPESMPLPDKLTLLYPGPMPSCVAVSVGDEIKTGQNLAPLGGAPLVSPATGPVEEINDFINSVDPEMYTMRIERDMRVAKRKMLSLREELIRLNAQLIREERESKK